MTDTVLAQLAALKAAPIGAAGFVSFPERREEAEHKVRGKAERSYHAEDRKLHEPSEP